MLTETTGCPEPLERIFRQVEEESERRAEEEQMRAARLALQTQDDDTMKRIKARRRGSISISRLGQYSPDDFISSPLGAQPTSPKVFSALASSSPFYKAHLANASTSSIASGASAFSDDEAHTEDPTQVMQVQQIAPKQSIAKKIIPRRLSRARSSQIYPSGDSSVIDVAVSETTTQSSSCVTEEGEDMTPSRRASVSAQQSLRSQRSLNTIPEPTTMSSTWVVTKARELTQKFKRRSRGDLVSPTSPTFAS